MTTNETLGRVRRARRKFDRAKEELEAQMMRAHEQGLPIRLIAIAAKVGHGSVHRLIVRRRS